MQLVNPGQPFSFSYANYDQNPSLFVAFSIYDVTSSVVESVTTVIGVLTAYGTYVGTYNGLVGHTYAIIGVVYTDNTYVTADITRAPSCGVWQTFGVTSAFFPFLYGAYDQNAGLFVQAKVYDMTSGTPSLSSIIEEVYIDFGVYVGFFTGIYGHSYQSIQAVYTDGTYTTVDQNRAPDAEEFEAFSSNEVVVNQFYQATLSGQQNSAILNGQQTNGTGGDMIVFTQGDTAVLELLATDGNGNPVNLTGAAFITMIKGPQGQIVSFPNSQHTVNPDQVNFTGQFSLNLAATDTAQCAVGLAKEIITKIQISSSTIYFRGPNQLEVFLPIPIQ